MKIFGWLFRILTIVLTLAVLAAAGTAWWGHVLTRQKTHEAPSPLEVLPDTSLIPRGEHLASVICAGCHGKLHALPLAGGGDNILQIPRGPRFGELFPPNLTPGGRLAAYSDAELGRAIREGINREGFPMVVMPSQSFHGLSDRDLAALIAYLRSQPPNPHSVPPRKLNFLGLLILGAHMFELSNTGPVTAPIADVPEAASAEYGEYLVSALDCRTCHGADLHGGKKGQFPPIGPDLVAVCATHELGAFSRAVREGVSARDGHSLDPEAMPYADFAHLNDLEVTALYTRLRAAH